MNKPRMVFFDIETTDLRAPFGNMLCCSFISADSDKVTTFRLDDRRYRSRLVSDDRKLAVAVKQYLEDSMIWVGWNSKMFDAAMVNSRLALAGLPPLEKRMHIDLMYYARRPFMTLYSSRLDAIAKTFKLGEQKTDLDPDTWVRARALDRKAMDYVVTHCEADVRVLKEAYGVLWPYIRTIHI